MIFGSGISFIQNTIPGFLCFQRRLNNTNARICNRKISTCNFYTFWSFLTKYFEFITWCFIEFITCSFVGLVETENIKSEILSAWSFLSDSSSHHQRRRKIHFRKLGNGNASISVVYDGNKNKNWNFSLIHAWGNHLIWWKIEKIWHYKSE